MELIAAVALRHNLWVVSDEIYATLQFDGSFRSPLAVSALLDRGIIVDSLSKSHAMPGFRAGFAIMPAALRDTFVKVAVNVFSCSPLFVQWAAVEALTASQECVLQMRREYSARTRQVAEQLNGLTGVSCAVPAGAFYVFPNMSAWFEASGSAATAAPTAHFADRVLNEALVAALPGTDFGRRGDGFIRFSCASSRESLNTAVQRLARFGEALGVGRTGAGRESLLAASR
jgi:aspartate/methionine/tyrosine aminotransferase